MQVIIFIKCFKSFILYIFPPLKQFIFIQAKKQTNQKNKL